MKKIIFKNDLIDEMQDGIICLKYSNKGDSNYSYITTNIEFILSLGTIDRTTEDFKQHVIEEDYFESDESFLYTLFNKNELNKIIEFYAYDIFSNKLIMLNSGTFDGEIIKIASLTSPDFDKNNIIKDSKLYIGNKTGTLSISNEFTNCLKEDVTLSELGIKNDDTFCVFNSVNEYDKETKELKSIYLLKGESE